MRTLFQGSVTSVSAKKLRCFRGEQVHRFECHLRALASARRAKQDHDLARLESSLVQKPLEERLFLAALSSVFLGFLELCCDGGLEPEHENILKKQTNDHVVWRL